MARSRGLSVHYLLMLSIDEENWGLRPFYMLKCWAGLPGYKQFVSKDWQSIQVEGWVSYVLNSTLRSGSSVIGPYQMLSSAL
jgi:hypothetical protein